MCNTNYLLSAILLLFLGSSTLLYAQKPKGKLFIIGGGKRPVSLVKQLIATADLKKNDYIVVLPMASEEPDSSFYYINKQFKDIIEQPVAMLNFDAKRANDLKWLDSLQHARLIFITGGDQNRFMSVVKNTPIYTAIHKAYQSGSTIAGTSAGAAVMCQYMITGNERLDTLYAETFDKLRYDNLETTMGMGLVRKVVIDQHFIKRSRYNRLLSAVIDFPKLTCIGIDESTAIVVRNKQVEVVGESAVVVAKKPRGIVKSKQNKVGVKKLHLSIYTEGQKFNIK